MVILLAMKLTSMTSTSDIPESFPSHASKAQQKRWLDHLCFQLVDTVTLLPDESDIQMVNKNYSDSPDDDDVKLCICGEGYY